MARTTPLVVIALLLGGCCGDLPEDMFNATSRPESPTTWRCDAPLGEACLTFYRNGIVEIGEAGTDVIDVNRWEVTCGGMEIYGNFDGLTLTDFEGGVADGELDFMVTWPELDVEGDASCELEQVAPEGPSCP